MLSGEGLQPSLAWGTRRYFQAASARLTDGPFAETRELIAGYWIWKCKSLAEAIEWAKKCPKSDGRRIAIGNPPRSSRRRILGRSLRRSDESAGGAA